MPDKKMGGFKSFRMKSGYAQSPQNDHQEKDSIVREKARKDRLPIRPPRPQGESARLWAAIGKITEEGLNNR